MSAKKTMLWALLLTLGVWAFFSWPLPRVVLDGVPSSSTNIEKGNMRRMFQGDHLQLLYNYWLVSDMIAGHTPWFHNLYEFNTGDDADTEYEGLDYWPSVLIFSLGQWLGGRALGWNLMGFISLWMTHLFTWLLLRRFVKSELAAAMLALLAIAFPYRWATLCGGSPTGFEMAWVPVLLWGIDSAIRRGRILGGCVAALGILVPFSNDAHVFFFGFLLIPFWAVFVLLQNEEMQWKSLRAWRRIVVACLPLAVMAVCLLGLSLGVVGDDTAETTVEHGRSLHEVSLFTPVAQGLFEWRGLGHHAAIYIGYVLPLFLIAGVLLHLYLIIRNPRHCWRQTVVYAALLAGIAAIIILALGPGGPRGGFLFVKARKLIPPYEMIRQTGKIFAILPPLMAVAAALSLNAFCAGKAGRPWSFAIPLCFVLLAVPEYKLQIRPTICLLDDQQPAYAAVAADAETRGENPRVIVLPIWPGDSSWASLYEHYVSLYRIRMINGYMPVVSTDYIDDVYHRFETANAGLLDDDQLDNLLARGIRYVLLHEDAFPEKVSYFPVGYTAWRLMNHPRLEFMEQGQNVWAFRILEKGMVKPPALEKWNVFFPCSFASFELEWFEGSEKIVLQDVSASGDHFRRFAVGDPPVAMYQTEHLQAPKGNFSLRQKGHGRLSIRMGLDNGVTNLQEVICDNDAWHWVVVPIGDLSGSRKVRPVIQCEEGSVDLDVAIYSSGTFPEIAAGEPLAVPAALFFHAGYTDRDETAVRFRSDYEPIGGIFYGPKLPLTDGEYAVTVEYETEAADGVDLGSFHLETQGIRSPDFPVVAGAPAQGAWSTRKSNLPFDLVFDYSRNADMMIRNIVFTRTK
ncbi:MAG: hypothetical protein KJ626_07345 [Verrucomicrobia bacterium]|nr:hypothetical protein [Verrucomicrobiota bacterium]